MTGRYAHAESELEECNLLAVGESDFERGGKLSSSSIRLS